MKTRTAKFHGSAGFTLIEMLVSTAIFVIVISALSTALIYVAKLQRRTNALRTANDNVRYITDFFSKEIRNGIPDTTGANPVLQGCGTYDVSSAGTVVQYWYQMQSVSGDDECIFLSSDGTTWNSQGTSIWITKRPAGSATTLSPQQLNIGAGAQVSLNFSIAHNSNTVNGNSDKQQPYVIIRGVVTSNRDPQNIVTVPFETSVSLPIYGISNDDN